MNHLLFLSSQWLWQIWTYNSYYTGNVLPILSKISGFDVCQLRLSNCLCSLFLWALIYFTLGETYLFNVMIMKKETKWELSHIDYIQYNAIFSSLSLSRLYLLLTSSALYSRYFLWHSMKLTGRYRTSLFGPLVCMFNRIYSPVNGCLLLQSYDEGPIQVFILIDTGGKQCVCLLEGWFCLLCCI